MSGLLCHVTWNNHCSTFLKFLSNLHSKDLFCDATIACHGKYYPVHQLVLSTCSEYFEEIFSQIKCRHPFIIIKDVKITELEALLDYMYKGEVNVPEDRLSDFIKAAGELKVKGLAAPDDPPEEVPSIKQAKRSVPLFALSPLAKRKKHNKPIHNESLKFPTTLNQNTREENNVQRTQLNPDRSRSESFLPNQLPGSTLQNEQVLSASDVGNSFEVIGSIPQLESLQRENSSDGDDDDGDGGGDEDDDDDEEDEDEEDDDDDGDDGGGDELQEDEIELGMNDDDDEEEEEEEEDERARNDTSQSIKRHSDISSTLQLQWTKKTVSPRSESDPTPSTITSLSSEESLASTRANSSEIINDVEDRASKTISKDKRIIPSSSSSENNVSTSQPAKEINTDAVIRTTEVNLGPMSNLNPMVMLNVEECIRAMEEMKRFKKRSPKDGTSSKGSNIDSVFVPNIEDLESSEHTTSFCSEGKRKNEAGVRDRDRKSINIKFSTTRESTCHYSDHEETRPLADSGIITEIRSPRKCIKKNAGTKCKGKLLQLYNLNHVPLNNVFMYRIFRNVNQFIECLLQDRKKEDVFARSLISIFRCYLNYNLISGIIAKTFEEHTWENQSRWVQKLASLDPPVFGKHLQCDDKKNEILFSNDSIPALMVIWQFRYLINRHCLVKDIKPGFTASPRNRFLRSIKETASSFQKEQLCIFKSHLRTFYRYSLKNGD